MLSKYIVLSLYFLTLFGIGYLAAGKVKDIKDYYIGGKRLGFWVAAFSSRATGASAWVLLGLTGMGAIFGVNAYWVALGTLMGEVISWFVMATPFKRLTDQYDSITVPDYLESRFQASTPWLRAIAATALSLFVMIYVSAQIDATGTAFETFLGWNYFLGALIGFLIVVAYMSFGGFVAVAWSDVFQGSMMVIGLVFLPFYFVWTIDTPTEIIRGIVSIDPDLINIWGKGGFTALNIAKVIGFLMIGLGYLGSPQLFVRYMAIKDTAAIDQGKWVSVGLTLFMNVSAVTIGLIGRYYFTSFSEDPVAILGNGGQNVLILLVEGLMPNIISGLYIAAILAAIMSTIDSLLVLASSAIARDFYQKIFHPSLQDWQLSLFSKKITVALSFAALILAMLVAILSPTRTIFWFVIFGWSGIAATFCPVMLLSLFWKGMNEKGAIASMLSGFLCIPLFKFVFPAISTYGIYFQYIAELFPSFIISIIFGIIVSRITR